MQRPREEHSPVGVEQLAGDYEKSWFPGRSRFSDRQRRLIPPCLTKKLSRLLEHVVGLFSFINESRNFSEFDYLVKISFVYCLYLETMISLVPGIPTPCSFHGNYYRQYTY